MEHNTLKPRTAAQYSEGALMIAVTVAKTARTTALALTHEHPYVLLFLLVFGVFLFPLSTTAIVGTLFLIFATSSTIFISVVFFAPALFMLTIFALIVWIISVVGLGAYRYIWAKEEHETILKKPRSIRYKMFRSTLENRQGSRSQRETLTALNMSTPLRSLHRMGSPDTKSIKRINRGSTSTSTSTQSPVDGGSVRANLENLVPPASITTGATNPLIVDFYPRDNVDASASAANEAA